MKIARKLKRFKITRRLKRIFRASEIPPDVSPDVKPEHQGLDIAASRMDDGAFPVILTCNTPYAYLGAANYVGRELADRPALFLIFFTWSMQKPRAVRLLSTAIAAYQDERPKHRILLLCNEPEEKAAFTACGAEAIHCNHNAFVNEDIFRPIPTSERIYDAVYNAAIVPWKRHRLASLVPSCAHRARLRDAVAIATDGRVKLHARLDDPVYRCALGDLAWPNGSDLAKHLGLT